MIKYFFNFIKNSSSTKAKIIKGTFWSFLGVLISKGFLLIAFFFIAHILSVEDYGKVGLLRSYISTFTFFSLASFGVTATKYLAIYKDSNKEKASSIYSFTRLIVFFLAVFIFILSYTFLDDLTNFVVADSNLKKHVLICSIAIFFSSLNGLQVGALSGLESFKNIAIVNVVNGILTLPIIIYGAKYYGLIGVVYGLLIINFFIWLSSAILLQKELNKNKINWNFSNLKSNFKVVKKFTIPSFFSGLMISPIVLACNSMLANYSDKGYEELGFYNAAFYYSSIISTLIGVVGQVFYPFAMREFKGGSKIFEFFNIMNSYFIGLLLALPLLCFPDFFIGLYGEKYANQNTYISLIFIAFMIVIIAQRQGIARNFAAGNYMWWSLLSNMFWGVNAIFWSWFFLEDGAKGRALAFLLAYLINTLVFIPFYLKKELINKDLIINKYNLLILLILSLGAINFLYVETYFLRIIMFLILLVSLIFIFKKWKKIFTVDI